MKKHIFKLPRCPNGTRRNKITKMCEPNNKKIVKKQSIKKQSVKKQSRCPNGTRRNKKTNLCEPNTKKDVSKKIISKKDVSKKIISKKDVSKNTSYRPTINKDLITILKNHYKTNINYNRFFGCNSQKLLEEIFSKKTIDDIKILNTKNNCISAFSDEGKNILLNNLKLINKINCNNILVPKQVLSNCWFNCFFMTFFISDKGRIFFLFFRQLMIYGKHLNNKLIQPKQLRNAFMLLNIAIETCYNYKNNFNDFELALNTNTIIKLIYNSLHNEIKYDIPDIKMPGNPLEYYTAIIKYLDLNNIIKIKNYNYTNNLFKKSNIIIKNLNPHLVVIEQHDYQQRKNITDILTINSYKYKLDSVIIRNTNLHHFICCFHCNNNEMIYDGASEIKLNNINWKKLLNKNEDWTLSYKNNNSNKIYYNFFKCYAIYFYYKI